MTCIMEDNIKMNLRGVNLIRLVQEKDKWLS